MFTAALLLGAGALGGLVNAMAGGATLFTFPAMLAAGLPPIVANASNAVAISPGHLLAAVADRDRLPRLNRRLATISVAMAAGAALGAAVLLVLPERLFVLPTPALIAFATLLFAASPQLQPLVRARSTGDHPAWWELPALFAAAVYGGFFGAGLGVILTAVVALTEGGDLRTVKVQKNLLATVVSGVAVLVFIARGAVRWPETLIMLVGALAGGYAGGRLIRVCPVWVIRWSVTLAGLVMTAIYAVKYWS